MLGGKRKRGGEKQKRRKKTKGGVPAKLMKVYKQLVRSLAEGFVAARTLDEGSPVGAMTDAVDDALEPLGFDSEYCLVHETSSAMHDYLESCLDDEEKSATQLADVLKFVERFFGFDESLYINEFYYIIDECNMYSTREQHKPRFSRKQLRQLENVWDTIVL